MEPDQVSRVFDAFYRGSDKSGGHGIGLSIVKRLSERFKWPVSLDSEPGVGTKARVNFPRGKALKLVSE